MAPKRSEICEVKVKGSTFSAWKQIDVEFCIDAEPLVAQATLVVAEVGDFKSWSTLRLKPGDPATVWLAGRKAIDGVVMARQVAYDPNSHDVRIIIQTRLGNAVVSSVKPEQMKNVTLTQAANRILQPSDIKFSLSGNPKNADKIFRSIITHVGETQLEAVARLCKMRNIHLMDDRSGNLVGVRNDGSEKSVGELREGRNILNAAMVWRWDTAIDLIKSNGQEPGHNGKSGDPVRNPAAQTKNPNYNGQRVVSFLAEHPGDKQDMQMRADHEVDLNVATMFDAQITVQGWLRNNGRLWLEEVRSFIDVYSPMMFPSNRETLGIYKANCRQGENTGTTTQLGLCLTNWLGHFGHDPIQSGSDATQGPQGQADAPPAQASSETWGPQPPIPFT